MNCSQCGTPLQPGWTVCPKCGQQFAQPVPYPTAPPPAAKKPSTFLVGCLGCGALLLVGFGGCAAFMASVGKKASQNIAATTSTPSSSTDDQTTSGDSSNVRAMDIPHIGKREVGIVDNVEYYIVKIERRKSIGDSMTSTDADGQFVIVRLAAINNDKQTHSLTTSLMTLQDSQGREFQPSSNGGTALAMSGDKTADMMISEVQPSVSKMVSLVYDVPPGDSGLKLKIPHGTFTDGEDAVIKAPSN